MKKRFGQNLLTDKNHLKKIVNVIGLKKTDVVLEIGAGSGLLTLYLAEHTKKIFAVELERNILKQLRDNLKENSVTNVQIVETNILDLDFKRLIHEPFKIVGNIPYNITSLILLKIFGEVDKPAPHLSSLQDVFLMLQYEVAERVVAKPDTKAYSPLTLLIQYFSEPKILFKVPAGCFFPKPKVDSAFVQFVVRNKLPEAKNPAVLKNIIRTGFQQRRKKLVNGLSKLFSSKEKAVSVFKNLGFDLNLRAENLRMKDYITLADAFIHQ